MNCNRCIHSRICQLWEQSECQNASCYVEDCFEENITCDTETLVHGKWLPTNDKNKKRCSNCDVIHLICQYPNGNINFCPNCGAKMDLE